jgi:hypothetical protein
VTGVEKADVPRPYWFEDINGEGYDADVDMEDVCGEEDGWVRVVIKLASKGKSKAKAAASPAKGASKAESKPKPKAAAGKSTGESACVRADPAGVEEHAISFQETEGKCLIRWGQCKLILPWSFTFEDVARAFAGLLGIKVARGKALSFQSADEEELDGSAELRDVMSDMSTDNWGAARTVIVRIKTA